MDIKLVNFLEYYKENCLSEIMNVKLYGGFLDEMDMIIHGKKTMYRQPDEKFQVFREQRRSWLEHSQEFTKLFINNYAIYKKKLDDNIEYCQMMMEMDLERKNKEKI
jgi:anthranilate/para-aminobenzoate synthase component II